MVEQKKYSIISISEDDDDVVIQAGDVSGCDVEEDSAASPAAGWEAAEPEDEPAEEPEEAAPSRADRERAAREAELERLRQAEEDLNAKAPFPAMRAVIFVVAIVLIVLAFVWLAFFR